MTGGAIPAGRGVRDADLVAHELDHDVDEVRTAASDLRRMVTRALADPSVVLGFDRLDMRLTRLQVTVDRLLRQTADLQALQLAPVRLARVVEQVVRAHDPHGHRIDVDATSAVVTLDAVKVERILDNLLLNALEHTPPGTHVSVRAWAPSGGQVVLTVEDDGPGLPPGRREQLVAPAEGARPPTGLALAAHLAQVHGGDLELVPGEYGAGLRAQVRLATRGGS